MSTQAGGLANASWLPLHEVVGSVLSELCEERKASVAEPDQSRCPPDLMGGELSKNWRQSSPPASWQARTAYDNSLLEGITLHGPA